MAETVQDPAAQKTYLDDWTEDLQAAAEALGLSELTIVDADVTAGGGATIVAHSVLPTGVIFKLDAAGVTPVPSNITVTTTVTLSNDDIDLGRHLIEIRET